jgi:hypothetical protein
VQIEAAGRARSWAPWFAIAAVVLLVLAAGLAFR